MSTSLHNTTCNFIYKCCSMNKASIRNTHGNGRRVKTRKTICTCCSMGIIPTLIKGEVSLLFFSCSLISKGHLLRVSDRFPSHNQFSYALQLTVLVCVFVCLPYVQVFDPMFHHWEEWL